MFGLDIPTGSNRTAILTLACILAVLLAFGGGVATGWHYGADRAQAKGDAALAELKREHAAAVSDSLAKALKRTDELVAQGNKISADLITTRASLTDARAKLNGRIHDAVATVPADCAFGPAFVGLLNAFAGLGPLDVPQTADTGGAAGGAQAGAVAGSGLRQGAPVAAGQLATPEDLAAWLRDYGAQCQEYKALSGARLNLLEEWAR